MTTEMINIKLDSRFLKEIDDVVRKNNYQSRTELIREALRQKVEDSKVKELQQYYAGLRKKFGISRQTTDEELEVLRKEASKEYLERHSKAK
jgi:metal-responsive CopG/Arc/MetJ family transcriptional regulator